MTDPVRVSGKPALLQNWLSVLGLIIAGSSFFAVVCLLAIDTLAHFPNPYMGILTYFIAPAVLAVGLVLVVAGVMMERRRLAQQRAGVRGLFPIIDLNSRRHLKLLGAMGGVAGVFLLVTAVGSYRSYHFTESTQFCGQACHTVMKPEFTAYQKSPHARVSCTECHIGPGADWYVRSKLSGAYQVYATLLDKFPRPIPTPIKNLRPAQETCEQCHWPKKFFGAVERENHHFLSDETNTEWTVRLLMKIGGGDPTEGPVGGIHWHMNIGHKIEYIHTDEARQVIPWMRVTAADGGVTVYESKEKPLTPEQVAAAEPRRMDCMDCHNRPSHIYRSPDRSVDMALYTGRIDRRIPFIKKQAVAALAAEYQSADEALRRIPTVLKAYYEKNHTEFLKDNRNLLDDAIAELRQIYQDNFFPEMKVNWRTYPDDIGHTIFTGCFRCHDGQHVSAEGRVVSKDCKTCHTIIAQGYGDELANISANGLEFQHPVDIGDMWKEMNCAECHTGTIAGE